MLKHRLIGQYNSPTITNLTDKVRLINDQVYGMFHFEVSNFNPLFKNTNFKIRVTFEVPNQKTTEGITTLQIVLEKDIIGGLEKTELLKNSYLTTMLVDENWVTSIRLITIIEKRGEDPNALFIFEIKDPAGGDNLPTSQWKISNCELIGA